MKSEATITMSEQPNGAVRLALLLIRVNGQFSQVKLFRDVALFGIESSQPHFETTADLFIRSLEESNWTFPDGDRTTEQWRSARIKNIAYTNRNVGLAAVDAATVIFLHSIVDHLASELLKLIGDIAPDDWTQLVRDKKISLRDVRQNGIENEFQKMLKSHVNGLTRKSLVHRIEVLHQLCKPAFGCGVNGECYVYDSERIRVFDEHRQRIIHRVEMNTVVWKIKDDVQFIREICNYLITICSRSYAPDFISDPIFQQAMILATASERNPDGSEPA